jgi:flagellar assembly protein FliH
MSGNVVERFPFDTVFENESDGQGASRRKKEPTFSVADLEAAKQVARAEGVAVGLEEARAGYERRATQAIEAAARQMALLDAAQAESNAMMRRNAIEVAVVVVRKLFPQLEARHGLAEVEQLVGDSLNQLFDEPRVVIRVHDTLLEVLQGRVEALAQSAGYPGRLILIADGSIGPGDCRVEWADGGAERLGDRLWQHIDTVLRRALGAPSDSVARWLATAPPSADAEAELRSAEAGAAPSAPDTAQSGASGQ